VITKEIVIGGKNISFPKPITCHKTFGCKPRATLDVKKLPFQDCESAYFHCPKLCIHYYKVDNIKSTF
jgi:hypothetical protein